MFALTSIIGFGVDDGHPGQSTCGNVGLTLVSSTATYEDQVTLRVCAVQQSV